MEKIIIIGSGVIGLSSAYYLNKKGFDVTVLTNVSEHDEEGCSFGNAGMIVPSHFTPLACPGAVRQGIKWMLSSKSPFYIRPKADKDLAQWLWKFYRSSNARNVLSSSELLLKWHKESKSLFEEIKTAENLQFEFQKRGLAMWFKTDRCAEEETRMAELAISKGLDAQMLNRSEAFELEPDFKPDVLGGVLYKSDAHLNPNHFMSELKKCLIKNGVQFHFGQQVNDLKVSDNSVEVISDLESFKGQKLIIAAGSWTGTLAKKLGYNIPLQGGKGYNFTADLTGPNINRPAVLCEAKVAVTPLKGKLRLGGTMEISGTDLSVSQVRSNSIITSASDYYSGLNSELFKGCKPWAGLRPVSPDGVPMIGQLEGLSNVYVNTGHAMMGLSLGPVSGKLISEMVVGSCGKQELQRLNPNRFARKRYKHVS